MGEEGGQLEMWGMGQEQWMCVLLTERRGRRGVLLDWMWWCWGWVIVGHLKKRKR